MTDKPTISTPNAGRIAYLATIAAIEAPLYQTKWASAARVRWELIHEIRAELDAVGFDWRTACQDVEKATPARERP
jgi:hypothetical protein